MTILFFFLLLLPNVLASGKNSVQIALTFDDFPMSTSILFDKIERVKIYAEKLAKLQVQTAFFCIGEQLEDEAGKKCAELVAKDHILANHTFTHPHLSGCTLAEFASEVYRTEASLSCYPQFRKWLRFPYLDYGDRSALGGSDRKRCATFNFLRQAGYLHGYVTINTFDWYVNGEVKKALQEGKIVDWEKVKLAYLHLLENWIDAYHTRWTQVLKRKFTHVLLLHENDLNALFLEDIVHMIREKKWEIVSADNAFMHPIPYLSQFANTKVRLFKGVQSLTTTYVDAVLSDYAPFKDPSDS